MQINDSKEEKIVNILFMLLGIMGCVAFTCLIIFASIGMIIEHKKRILYYEDQARVNEMRMQMYKCEQSKEEKQ